METSESAPSHALTLLHHNVPSTQLGLYGTAEGEYPVGVVHGIVDAQGNTHNAAEYPAPEGAQIETTELTLSPEKAKLFVEYYREHFVDPCMKGQSCHGMVAHVMGWDDWTSGGPARRPVMSDSLQSGESYSVVKPPDNRSEIGASEHSMLGTADSTKNVSVLGLDRPLAVMSNQDSRALYGGSTGEIRRAYDRADPAQRRRHKVDNFLYRARQSLGSK